MNIIRNCLFWINGTFTILICRNKFSLLSIKNIFVLFALISLACRNENPPVKIPPQEKVLENSSESDLPEFWKEACNTDDLKLLFDCNAAEKDYYQIELLQDPFKDYVIISLIFKQENIDKIYLTRFHFSMSDKPGPNSKRFKEKLCVINPMTKASLYFYYNKPRSIHNLHHVKQINHFFTNTLWALPTKENVGSELDPETWHVKGRKNGKESHWTRHLAQDSLFYSNLQLLLDICKVKDYKYKNSTILRK